MYRLLLLFNFPSFLLLPPHLADFLYQGDEFWWEEQKQIKLLSVCH